MSPSKTLFFLCLSFIIGVFLESVIKIPQIFVCGFLILGIIATCVPFLFKKLSFMVGFCLLIFILGILRVQISDFSIANDKLNKLNGKGQIILTGIVNDAPDLRDTSQKIKVKINDSEVLVTTKRYPEYHYLDTIKLVGKLEVPKNTDTFNYQNYLLKDGIYSVMNFPKIEVVSTKRKYSFSSYLYSKVLLLKEKLNQSIQYNSSPPHSLILEGIILGDNKNMTQDLRQQLSNTGLRFLTAISGVHVVIVSVILVSFLMFLGLGRIGSSWFSIIFVWIYVALTGFTASGIRAATMGSIFIISGALGRQNTSSRTIVLAGATMLIQNPLLLIYDIGFQLSFMASLGIIYLKPSVSYLLKNVFREKFSELTDIISVTITAQIFTMPLMIYDFGVIPLVSPITNLLILPVMPWILSFGFIFSILGSFSKVLGFIFYLPTWLLISYFLKIMDFFSQSWMSKVITNVPIIWLIIFYIGIAFVTIILNKKYSGKFI